MEIPHLDNKRLLCSGQRPGASRDVFQTSKHGGTQQNNVHDAFLRVMPKTLPHGEITEFEERLFHCLN